MNLKHLPLLSIIFVLLAASHAEAQGQRVSNVTYAVTQGTNLRLDLYLPANATSPRLVVWVHGGAWSGGVKDGYPLPLALVSAGFALASLEFRLSGQAPFPAQLHDIKGAIRFLRANSSKYGYRSDRIAIAGDSSGGHLAALVGTTNGEQELEGDIGGNLDQSSEVQAIVDYYGPTNLTTILDQSTAFGLSVRVPALRLLLGGPPDRQVALARQASPVFHVRDAAPPILIFHGDDDIQVPIEQSRELERAYKQHKQTVSMVVVRGAEHGDDQFYNERNTAVAIKFLRDALGP